MHQAFGLFLESHQTQYWSMTLAPTLVKTLKTILRQAQGTQYKHWDDPLTKLVYAYNTAVQELIGRPHFSLSAVSCHGSHTSGGRG